jgi:hypothetical protein
VRAESDFFADWWVVGGLKYGRGSWGDVTPEHRCWWLWIFNSRSVT